MSYVVLARRYRPQTFEDLVGQEPIVTTLRNAIRSNRVAHAYLLAGPPRGGEDFDGTDTVKGAKLPTRTYGYTLQYL